MRTQTYSATLKQEAVKERLGGEKRGAQIARERGIDYTTLRRWRDEYDQRGVDAWTKPTALAQSGDAKVAELGWVVGQLIAENMVLRERRRWLTTSKSGTPSSM